MYGRPLTEEERLARAIAGMRNPYTDPKITMESQVAKELAHIDPNFGAPRPRTRQDVINEAGQSTVGRQARLKSQQAYADALRSQPMAKGKTVGPLDVYVGPNWGESVADVGRQALGGYMSGRLAPEYAAIDEAETAKAAAGYELEDLRTGEEQDFTAGQNALKQAVERELATDRNALTRRGQNMVAGTARAGQQNQANIAQNRIKAEIAADTRATKERREEGSEGGNYSLDGKIVHIVEGATGSFHMGDVNGPVVDSETMARAVEYRPGTDKGTIGDADAFQMPVEEQGQATPKFLGNLLTSDYFDSSTGAFNPQRWAGAVAVGPDGKMIQATQSQMATSTLGQMSQRMVEINLRPWTEKEIETITKDFPTPNSKYPDWANFTLNIAIPKLNAKFEEAKASGRTTEAVQNQVMNQMYADVIEGARKNGMNLNDLVQLGMDRELIKKYLRGLE